MKNKSMSDSNIKIGRNDNCPCGAKRSNSLSMKYKNCCLKKLPRHSPSIMVAEDNEDEDPIVGLLFNDKGDYLVKKKSGIVKKPDHSYFLHSRTKKNGGNKTLSMLYKPTSFNFSIEALLPDYTRAFVIDTNTKNNISVSCVMEVWAQKTRADQVKILHHRIFCLFFKNASDPEKFAWNKLNDWIVKHPRYQKDQKFCVITDHDLGNHEKYNSRKLPIYGETLLPENVSFLYATDASVDSIANKLIRECDVYAGTRLNELINNDVTFVDGKEIRIDQIKNISS